MKRKNLIFSLLAIFTMFSLARAQDYYAARWRTIAANNKSGKIASNLPILNEIRSRALAEQQMPQLLRAEHNLFFTQQQLGDDPENDFADRYYQSLLETRKSLNNTKLPVFDLYLAHWLNSYFAENFWRLSRKGITAGDRPAKITNWDKDDFQEEIQRYLSQINPTDLTGQRLADYPQVFDVEEKPFTTLAEVWYEKQITFYRNGTFFSAEEQKKNAEKVAGLYTQAIKNSSGAAQWYFRHQQVNFLHECDFCTEKISDLQKLLVQKEDPYQQVIAQELANILSLNNRKPEALELLKQWRDYFPKSRYAEQLVADIKNLESRYLRAVSELVSSPEKPIHLVLESKNVASATMEIRQIPAASLPTFFQKEESSLASSGKVIRSQNLVLPQISDLEDHRTSIAIETLSPGAYLFIISYGKNDVLYLKKLVSAARAVRQTSDTDAPQSLVYRWADRETGKTLLPENIRLLSAGNRRGDKGNAEIKMLGDGQFQIVTKGERYLNDVLLTDGKNLDLLENVYQQEERRVQEQQLIIQLFTDRKIYRPGQTVYWKAIVSGKASVESGKAITLKLTDRNGNQVETVSGQTNAFGSYSGSFLLPNAVLPGNFYLSATSGNSSGGKSILVEEYKRPKLEITFQPLPEDLQFGKTVVVAGMVKNYNGTPVGEAPVKFTVRRSSFFWHPWRGFYPQSSGEIVQSGTVKTAADGTFTLPIMPTSADEKVEKLAYDITVSAMDATGESQEARVNFVAGKKPFVIETEKEVQVMEDQSQITLHARAVNANDKKLTRQVRVVLETLRGPEKVYRKKFQSVIQDLPKLSKSDFDQLFPHDYYDSLAVNREYEVAARKDLGVFSLDSQTQRLTFPSPGPGHFRLKFLQPQSQDSISGQIRFQLFSKNKFDQNPKAYLALTQIPDSLQAGKDLNFTVFSSVEGAMAEAFVQYGGQVIKSVKNISSGFAEFNFALPASLENQNINLQVRLVAFNEVQTEERTLKFIKPNKDLVIQWSTFRDKILPGSRQVWQLGVKKADGSPAEAEVLAMMYDASLDVLAPNRIRWETVGSPYFPRLDFSSREDLRYSSQEHLIGLSAKMVDIAEEAIMPPAPPSYAPLGKRTIANVTSSGLINQESADSSGQNAVENNKFRSNFAETAFFYPHLITDKTGSSVIEFTAPDVLTRWNVQVLAHNTVAEGGTDLRETVTYKPFLLTPNYPRFLRTGDRLNFTAKINREGNGNPDGTAEIQIRDIFTGEEITGKFVGQGQKKNFRFDAQNTAVVQWELNVPTGHGLVEVTTRASSGNQSDGERVVLSVLPQKPTVKQGYALMLKPGEKETVRLRDLLPSGTNPQDAVLRMHTNSLTDYLLQLPPLLQNEDKTADALMSKIMAAQVGLRIFEENPELIPVIREKLAKEEASRQINNETLNNLPLAETPWLPAAQDDKAKAAALLKYLDTNTTVNAQKEAVGELLKLQNADGGFSWYADAPSDLSVSLRVLDFANEMQWLKSSSLNNEALQKLVSYTDASVNKILKEEKKAVLYQGDDFADYLAVRPLFKDKVKLPAFYPELMERFAKKISKTQPADMAFYEMPTTLNALQRNGRKEAAQKVINYLSETAIHTQNQGIYWKQNNPGWGWTQSAVATELAILQAMKENANVTNELQEGIDLWLASQYETGNFRNSADAASYLVYQIKNGGIQPQREARLSVNGQILKPEEMGGGFSLPMEKISSGFTLENTGTAPLFGGIFWQGEDFSTKSDDVKVSAETRFFLKVIQDKKETLVPVAANSVLKVGDKVVAKTDLNADRNMQFVTLQIHRASALEPVTQLSGTQWKNGLSYYLANTDRTTNVFIHYLPKGKFEITQEFFVNASGTVSGGTTVLQNYHAPQVFTGTGPVQLKIQP